MNVRYIRNIFPAFKAGVKKGHAFGLMTAANGLNNDLCSDHQHLLNDRIFGKKTWKFEGFVLTDWCQSRSTDKAALAGLDVSMPIPEIRFLVSHCWKKLNAGKYRKILLMIKLVEY